MIKNNKKTIFLLGGYTLILVAVILTFVFAMQFKNSNSVTTVYRAIKNIEEGQTVDNAFIQTYTEAVEIPKVVVDEMEKSGNDPIRNVTEFKGSALTDIPQGTFLSNQMFGEIIVESTMDTYKNKYGFTNPYYSVLKTTKTNTPVSGFSVGQEISIEGTVNLSAVSSDDLENDSQEVYNGILTNKCMVHSLVTDQDGNVTNVGVILELSTYPTVNFFETYGNLKFHEGKLDAIWETTNSKILEDLWNKTGFKNDISEALPTYATYTNVNGEKAKKYLAQYRNEVYDEKTTKLNFLQLKNDDEVTKEELTLYTPYNNMVVSHYSLNGGVGSSMDLTGVNTEKKFNSRTGLYEVKFSEEGLYRIKFFDTVTVNKGTEGTPSYVEEIGLVNEVYFVIEKASENQVWDSENLRLEVGYYNGKYAFSGFEFDGSITKSYFDEILKELQIDLKQSVHLNDTVFANKTEVNKIDYSLNNLILGTLGDENITNFSIYFGEDVNSFNLFRKQETDSGVYRPISTEQVTKICTYLGITDKKYDFFNKISFDEAEQIILEIEEMYMNVASYQTLSTKEFEFGENKTKTNVIASLHLAGLLWSGELSGQMFEKGQIFHNLDLKMNLKLENGDIISGIDVSLYLVGTKTE